MIVHEIILGDTLDPLAVVLTNGGDPRDVSSLTVKVKGQTSSGSEWIALTATGVTKHPTKTCTADADTEKIVCTAHKAQNGQQIVFSNSGGALPSGLTAGTVYYVRDREPNAFKVSLSPDGSVVPIAGAGTGTHSFYIVGCVQYDFQAADVDTAGEYKLRFVVVDGSNETSSYPVANDGTNAEWVIVRIAA